MSLIMYTKTGCPWCDDARTFLQTRGTSFEEREVRNNPIFMKELEDKSNQTKTPTLDFDGEILADTDKEAIEFFLNKRLIA